MLEEEALVVAVERDDALLEIVRRAPCGLCGRTRGCGVSVWSRLLGQRNSAFRAANRIQAQPGDSVVVGVDERALLDGALAAYGVPLLLLLAGAALGGAIFPAGGDFPALAGAGTGLALALFWLWRRPGGRAGVVILRPATAGSPVQHCHRGA